jgi:hypothetical protein
MLPKVDKVNVLRFHCFEYFEVVTQDEFIDGHGCSSVILSFCIKILCRLRARS